MIPIRPKTDQQRILEWATLAVLLALTGYAAFRIAGPYLEALMVGAGLAALFHPLFLRLAARMDKPRLAAFLCTALLIAVVLIPLSFFVTTIARQLQEFVRSASAGDIDASRWWAPIDAWAVRLGYEPGQLETTARARAQEAAAYLLRGTVSGFGAASSAVLQFVVIVGSFYVSLINGRWLYEQTLVHSPLGLSRTSTLLETVHHVILSSFYGIVGVAAVQGGLLGVGVWIAGLPIPGLWALGGAVVSVLPILGSALLWIPGAIVLFSQGRAGMAIFLIVWGAVLVSNIDNLVRPWIVASSVPVSGLLIFIAILGGVQAFGFTGIFAGPVTLAVGMALLRMLREELREADLER